MSEIDLRGPLIRGFDEISNDLAVGHYEDPHVAFVVMVYPDREPDVVVVAQHGPAASLTRARTKKPETADTQDRHGQKGPWFAKEDLLTAAHTIDDAYWALRMTRAGGGELGDRVKDQIRSRWALRRDTQLANAVKQQTERRRREAQCPHCGGRYTARGLAQHLARSRYCSRQEAATKAEGKEGCHEG